METVRDWDTAEFLDTKEDVLAYLEAAFKENDTAFLIKAIGNAARSPACAAGDVAGNPSFATVLTFLDKLGFRLTVELKRAS